MRPFTQMIRAGLFAGLCLTAPFSVAQHDHDAAKETSASSERPWSQADSYWGADKMAQSQSHMLHHHGAGTITAAQIDRFEIQSGDEINTGVWDADFWHGGDINKLWVKTEGEYDFDDDTLEDAEVQVLWSRAVTPYLDVQTGLRHDFEPEGRTYGMVGMQGELPYRVGADGAFFLSENGDLTAGVELEYELLLTQRLHLGPRAELSWSAQEVRELGFGEGFTSGAFGLRLSYDVIREVSPYIGVEWQGSFGKTEDMITRAGGASDATVFLIGIKGWY